MKPFRDALPDGFLAQMQQKLGQEETLRLLWPIVVGTELGATTRLLGLRQNRLRVAVPDATWKRTLGSLEQAVLEAVHQVFGEEVGRSVELIEDPALAGPPLPKEKISAPLPQADLAVPLDGIRDEALRRMFQQSAQKYFARRGEARD